MIWEWISGHKPCKNLVVLRFAGNPTDGMFLFLNRFALGTTQAACLQVAGSLV